MQVAEIVRHAEFSPVLVMLMQQNAEVVVTHIGRKVVPDNTIDHLAGFLIDNLCLQHFYKRNAGSADLGVSVQFHGNDLRSEEHTSELQSRENLVCRLLLEKKNRASSRHRDPGEAGG